MIGDLAIWVLEHCSLSEKQHEKFSRLILKDLGALPIEEVIKLDETGTLLVDGRPLDTDIARKMSITAKAAIDNVALKMVFEQVTFAAIAAGVHRSETEKHTLFMRAALWSVQQIKENLKLLLQDGELSL